eukprot:4039183-Prymnesium_polylepis.2
MPRLLRRRLPVAAAAVGGATAAPLCHWARLAVGLRGDPPHTPRTTWAAVRRCAAWAARAFKWDEGAATSPCCKAPPWRARVLELMQHDRCVGEGAVMEGQPWVMLHHKGRVDQRQVESKARRASKLPHPPPMRRVERCWIAGRVAQRKRDAVAALEVHSQRLRYLDALPPLICGTIGPGHQLSQRPRQPKQRSAREGIRPRRLVHALERAPRRAL